MIYKYDKIIAEYISIGGNSICLKKKVLENMME